MRRMLFPLMIILAIVPTLAFGQVSYTQKLIGSDFSLGELFGRRVAISGDTIAVNAKQSIPGTNKSQGLVYVFVLRKGVWIQQAKLVTAVLRRKDAIMGGLAIDGDTIVAGVLDEDVGKDSDQGTAYVFTRQGKSWTKKVRLKASGGTAAALFGSSVAISGDTIIIGAPGTDTYPDDGMRSAHGAAYVFTKNGDEWMEKQIIQGDSKQTVTFGTNVAIDNKTAVISTAGDYEDGSYVPNAIYIFSDNGTGWKKEHKIVSKSDDSESATGSGLSDNLAIEGNTLAIGGYLEGDQTKGAVFVFVRGNGKWTKQATLIASNDKKESLFGWGLDMSGDKIVVGSSLSNETRGSAYLFRRKITGSKTVWVEESILTAPDAFMFDRFGGDVGISGKQIVIGADNQDLDKRNSNIGASYTFVAGDESSAAASNLVNSRQRRTKIKLVLNARRNGYTVLKDGGKSIFEAAGVEDPITKKPLKGPYTISYGCDVADNIRTREVPLSEGQTGRVAIACALIHEPEVLLMDEPTP